MKIYKTPTSNPVDDESYGENGPPAPGPLRLVQEFLHALDEEPDPAELLAAAEIRLRHERGGSQPTLAAEYGFSQPLVSAILRGKLLVAPGEAGTPAVVEDLSSPAAAQAWLTARRLLAPSEPLTHEDLLRLLQLRGALGALALANNGQPLDPKATKAIDRLAAESPVALRFSGPGAPALEPVAAGINGAIALILAVVFEAMREGTWERLKMCPGEGCRHVFYDYSRNRTRNWCSMSICGNRTKVRNYQARRRTATPHR